MQTKTLSFADLDRESWNQLVARIPDASYAHAWDYLNFHRLAPGLLAHESFVALENDETPLVVVPLAVSACGEGTELAFPRSTPLPAPAVARVKPSVRRQLLDDAMRRVDDLARAHGAQRCVFGGFPASTACAARDPEAAARQFELLRYPFVLQTTATLCVDLSLDRAVLTENLSKYHRRHIVRAAKAGQAVRIYTAGHNPEQVRARLDDFHLAHRAAAGRETQSQACWDVIAVAAEAGCGTLFVNFFGETPLSYLYCAEFGRVAVGWSQANVPEHEAEHSPRHLLEWEAMMHYQARGFGLYEVGERFQWPQPFHVPTHKEITIADFKERYGGFVLPKTYWVGYYDRVRMAEEMRSACASVIDALPCARLPDRDAAVPTANARD